MTVGVGVVGAGVISDTYLENLGTFPDLAVRFVADLDTDRAARQAERHGVPHSGTLAELLDRDDVEVVVNLTIPAAHVEVATAAVTAGKHVWNEKPLGLTRASARELLDLSHRHGLRVGCAPDTMLGAGLQTAFRAMAEGRIGRPATALAVFQSPGPDAWHPAPEFLFQEGAGPLFDMGPYYLTTLAHVFGPVCRVTATGTRGRETRVIRSGPRAGTAFPVTVPTSVNALVEYRDGGVAQLVMSFDSGVSRTGLVEITGPAGTAVLPDPNRFDGNTTLHLFELDDTSELPPQGHTATRGVGVLDLVRAAQGGAAERASGELAFHVLDVMLAVEESIRTRAPVPVTSDFVPVAPLPEGWDPMKRTA
ncbi:putative dehydrogenase [Stackebrandtia albiflava]|uniref:Putative dehydrogenase n=1 Tax=Stackebrandtia albiflava TaxID=406432 RepID=A0A562V509_9ACTN|nr:Gfo/Idh/MocA family oxidoreductase [Stackebrandtia albiflava]TWJ12912.1 putative dehydrogenase [Stackebrandtia albiflava]